MKNTYRIIPLLFVLLFSTFAFANAETIDISNLSYDELVALRQRVDLAIMESDEWKEVTVPTGKYSVGLDIPAGDYTVVYNGDFQAALEVYSTDGRLTDIFALGSVWGTNSIGKITLSEGQTIGVIYGELVFSPYKGLGF